MHILQQWSSGWGQSHLTVPRLVNITLLPSPTFPFFFYKIISLLLPPRDPPLQNLRSPRDHEGGDGVEGPTAGEAGRREDDNDDESRRRRKLEKGEEPATKDANKEPFFNDTKFAVDLLKSAFRKLEVVGVAFNIKAHHEVDKDPSVKGLAFRIHGLVERSRSSPWSSGLAAIASSTTATTALTEAMVATTALTEAMVATTAPTAATAATTAGLRLIDRLLYQLVIMCVCFCVFVRLLDMNCLVCLSIMNCLVN
jgi:hypothetical protein